jgi:hypothetical protein
MRKALAPLTQEQLKLLSSPLRRQADPDATCDASIAYLRAVNQLPPDERRVALRVLYSRNEPGKAHREPFCCNAVK